MTARERSADTWTADCEGSKSETRMSERRTRERQRVLKGGKIVFNNGASVLDCTVRNVSGTGACLMVVNALAVPAEFDLQLGADQQPCEVIWRQTNRVGIRFRHAMHSGADAGSREGALDPSESCPGCRVNSLIHALPAGDGLPEVQAFRCDRCGETVVRENDEHGLVASG
jgi:hypothetical protein